ncbi:MAG TPA: secretin N-terminal domain-containing protein [Candidatus Wallbacteria bacterium]|nr:secretin N-terminal domain-containing protein [Candidatus Wallbacteria bacterium]
MEELKMPAGDAAYLEIQEFVDGRETREWFNLAYQKGYSLWKIDFVNALSKYFKDENRFALKEKNDVLTEVLLDDEKYGKLSDLISKLKDEFTGLGLRITERSEVSGPAYINILMSDNKLLRITKSATGSLGHATDFRVSSTSRGQSGEASSVAAAADPMWVFSSSKDAEKKEAVLDAETAKKLAEKISFNVTNRPIWEVLEGFLRSAELNAAVSHNISGNITLYVKDTTVKSVLDNICKNYGLVYTITDKMVEIKQADQTQMETLIARLKNSKAADISNIVMNVKSPNGSIIVDKKTNSLIIKDNAATIENLKKMIEALDRICSTDKVTTKLISLNYADAAKIKTMLQQTLTLDIGMMEVDSRTNTLILTDIESNVVKMESIIKRLDMAQTTSKIIQCKYVTAEDLKSTLNASLKTVLGVTSDAFLIESDKTTNSLIITASPINLAKIESFVNQLDVRTKQVLIEARIVQVNLSRDENMGVNWNRLMQGGENGVENGVGFKTFAPIGDDGIGGITYKVGTLSTGQLRMILQALQKKDNSKVIACPGIVTANRKKAYVNVETTYPVRRETVVTTTTGPVTSITYEKQNVSVRLEVTPAINPDGFIAMEVNPKVQGLAGKVDNSQPIVSTKETLTNVIVKNGHTIVIAGLIEEEDSRSKTNIPFFGNLPGVSALFRNQSNTNRKNETIIFITPRLIDGGISSASASGKK